MVRITKSKYTGIAIIAAVILIIYLISRRSSIAAPLQVNNLETWEWVDWKGRPRQIAVHRETKVA